MNISAAGNLTTIANGLDAGDEAELTLDDLGGDLSASEISSIDPESSSTDSQDHSQSGGHAGDGQQKDQVLAGVKRLAEKLRRSRANDAMLALGDSSLEKKKYLQRADKALRRYAWVNEAGTEPDHKGIELKRAA